MPHPLPISFVFGALTGLEFSPQCPENCGLVRRRHRDVQCVDSQSKRPLRPFHCRYVSSRPLSALVCPNKPCMNWTVSPWGLVGQSYIQIIILCAIEHMRAFLGSLSMVLMLVDFVLAFVLVLKCPSKIFFFFINSVKCVCM